MLRLIALLFLQLVVTAQSALAESQSCAPGAEYAVHLTFDDGPHLSVTPQVLDVLNKYQVTATFFINTSQIRSGNLARFRALLQRAKDEGHTIGFHTAEHISHTDLQKTDEVLIKNLSVPAEIADLVSPYIRFPYGQGWFRERDPNRDQQRRWIMDQARQLGFQHIGWDIDSWDWSKDLQTLLPESVQTQICRQQGGIVLMHDRVPFTGAHLEEMIILPTLRAGHKFVDLNTMIQTNNQREQSLASLNPAVVGAKYCFGNKASFYQYYDQVRVHCDQIPDSSQDEIPSPN